MQVKTAPTRVTEGQAQQQVARLAQLYARLQQDDHDRAAHREAIRLLREEGASAPETLDLPFLGALLEILFTHEFARHQPLAPLTLNLLKRRHSIGDHPEQPSDPVLWRALARAPLFLLTMRRVVNTDLAFEGFLRQLRRHLLLDRLAHGPLAVEYSPLLAALAEQNFNNEYLLCEEEEELLALQRLEGGTPTSGDPLPDLLLLAMYHPPSRDPRARSLAPHLREHCSPEVRPTLEKILFEPLEEARLAPLIPSFGAMACATSQAVRAQYEENPYPRWFALNHPRPLDQTLAQTDPSFVWPAAFGTQQFHILVPGCGTGRHPIALALANPNAQVLAVDISRTSLAYAQRMAYKHRIGNVSFLHGDLLDLPDLGRRFHHIDCGGVLHHLRDPLRGWEALDQVLLPGGTMHIEVYSKVARMHLHLMQQQVGQAGIAATPRAMKHFRVQMFTDAKYRSLREGLGYHDLFYLSGVRDALFHTCEHVFTLRELQELIERFNHRFLGFRAKSLKEEYLRQFPGDPRMNSFANWKRFERHYAGSGSMFAFLVQKPESAPKQAP